MRESFPSPEIPPNEIEKKHNAFENAFTIAVVGALLDATEEAMLECDYSDQEIEEYKSTLNNLSDEEKKAVLAIPDTLRQRAFARYRQKLDEQDMQPKDIISDQLETANKYGFTVGYHVSNSEIPKTTNKYGEQQWVIQGNEFDDRDEMPMAYYSLDRRNLFSKNQGDHIYLVRASTSGEYRDKQDNNNNWGRAPTLSIIESVNKKDIDAQAERIMDEQGQQEKEKADEEAPA